MNTKDEPEEQRYLRKRPRRNYSSATSSGIQVGGLRCGSESVKHNQRIYIQEHGITRRKVFNATTITSTSGLYIEKTTQKFHKLLRLFLTFCVVLFLLCGF